MTCCPRVIILQFYRAIQSQEIQGIKNKLTSSAETTSIQLERFLSAIVADIKVFKLYHVL